jgi:Suppressor of fused protein (SUFU)
LCCTRTGRLLSTWMCTVRPSVERAFFTLMTSGMSDLDMEVPEGAEDWVLSEACLCLPKEWPLDVNDFGWRAPEYFWLISLLYQVARYPHRHNTWFGWGHTANYGGPVAPGVDFSGIILLPPQTLPEGVAQMETSDGRTIVSVRSK